MSFKIKFNMIWKIEVLALHVLVKMFKIQENIMQIMMDSTINRKTIPILYVNTGTVRTYQRRGSFYFKTKH